MKEDTSSRLSGMWSKDSLSRTSRSKLPEQASSFYNEPSTDGIGRYLCKLMRLQQYNTHKH